MQKTIQKPIEFHGHGLHNGQPVSLQLHPAPADHGIVFKRTDITDRDNIVPMHFDRVYDTQLCTCVRNDANVEIRTVEHLSAALAGTGVNNLLIEINAPEMPIMDGSSVCFIRKILHTGLTEINKPIRAIKVLKEIHVVQDGARASLAPSAQLEIDCLIDFTESAIGRQAKQLPMVNGAFIRELSDSRTFCRAQDVAGLKANGLALGGSLQNAVVVDGDTVMNPEGYRHTDECVRHKMLDVFGDLYLAGGPMLARYTGVRIGHSITNRLLRALFADDTAWEWVECSPEQIDTLPGAHISAADFPLAS